MPDKQEMIIYSAEDGRTKVSVRVQDGNIWLSRAQMAELFQTTPQNITIHIKNIYDEGELQFSATCKDYLQVQTEGARQPDTTVKEYLTVQHKGIFWFIFC